MSTNKTSSLGLHSWVRSDLFSMDEFNENFSKIDAAVAAKVEQSTFEALKTQVAAKAEQSALEALKTQVGAKAEQSALEALKTQVGAKAAQSALDALAQRTSTLESGRLRAKLGTYAGNGTYGSGNARTLTFDFEPKLVIITGQILASTTATRQYSLVLIRPITQYAAVIGASASVTYACFGNSGNGVTWGGNSVSWYYTGDYRDVNEAYKPGGQANMSGQTYNYLAIG